MEIKYGSVDVGRLLLISMRRTHVRTGKRTAADMECIVDEEQLRLYVFSCASSAKLKNRYAN